MKDDTLRKLHNKVKQLKHSRELEEKYMQFEELLIREHEEGHEEGSQQMLDLICLMIADGRTADISRLKEDKEFFEEMTVKYQK